MTKRKSGEVNQGDQSDEAARDLPPNVVEELDEALWALDQLAQEDPEEALVMFERLPEEVQAMPTFQLSLALSHRNLRQLDVARELLEGVLRDVPDEADAHHMLADVLEDLGEERLAGKHYLKTLHLDQAADDEDPHSFVELTDAVTEHGRAIINELPEQFREPLAGVPILVEQRPSEAEVEDGLDPRALGVFSGPDHAEHREAASLGGPLPSPTRIVLYASNLVAIAPDPDELREQIRITLLHEIGHYFGLDEGDMVRLGLD